MELLKLIYETYKEEFELNLHESLTKTFQIDQSIGIIDRDLTRKGLKKNTDYTLKKNGNTFHLVLWELGTLNLEEDIIKAANRLGWFPAFLTISKGYAGKWNADKIKSDTKGIDIKFEAKFDEQEGFKIPKHLYHATLEKNYKKIQRIGLTPKSRSKIAAHPDRVYLAKNLQLAKDMADMFVAFNSDSQKENKYVILKITTDLIPGGYFRLYKDPNFADKGYYTMNNIPPYAIEVAEYYTVK